MYLRDFFALKPFHDYSLCSVCILPQPAFYSQSAVCILHAVCILPLVRNLQSAVRSLLVKKFYLFTVHFSTAPLRNFDKGRMCYLWPRLCRNLSFLLHSVFRLGVVVGGNFNPAQDVLISCIHCWTQTDHSPFLGMESSFYRRSKINKYTRRLLKTRRGRLDFTLWPYEDYSITQDDSPRMTRWGTITWRELLHETRWHDWWARWE